MIAGDTKEFTINIDQFIEKAKGRAKTFAIEFINDLATEVVTTSPYKTGFLRGAWWAQLNGEPPAVGGNGNLSAVLASLSDLKLGDVYYQTNGAAYAMRLEFGFVGEDSLGRVYNQAPRAWVRTALGRAEIIANEAAVRVAGG